MVYATAKRPVTVGSRLHDHHTKLPLGYDSLNRAAGMDRETFVARAAVHSAGSLCNMTVIRNAPIKTSSAWASKA